MGPCCVVDHAASHEPLAEGADRGLDPAQRRDSLQGGPSTARPVFSPPGASIGPPGRSAGSARPAPEAPGASAAACCAMVMSPGEEQRVEARWHGPGGTADAGIDAGHDEGVMPHPFSRRLGDGHEV